MARKAQTETEKALTPLSEEFLANPILAEKLHELAAVYGEDGSLSVMYRKAQAYAAISQAANYIRCLKVEEGFKVYKQEIVEQVNMLSKEESDAGN